MNKYTKSAVEQVFLGPVLVYVLSLLLSSHHCHRSPGKMLQNYIITFETRTLSITVAFLYHRYLGALSFFHFSEYIVTSVIRPSRLGLDSFLLNHSPAYKAAAVASWIEFFIEIYFFPDLKALKYVTWAGLGLCIFGEVLRKGAMLTAGFHFDHLIRYEKEEGHSLITHGVYSYMRHPAYVGWFYWAIATQLILVNPVCVLAYMWASWNFFNARIFEEECTLLNFFGEDYLNYQSRVPTGLPFIAGYRYDKM
nr:EOG090X0CFU [Lepidurus arcticus]